MENRNETKKKISVKLKKLMERSFKTSLKKRKRQRAEEFFSWFEKTFGITGYIKHFDPNGDTAAVFNNIVFVNSNTEDIKAQVFLICPSAGKSFEEKFLGEVSNVEEFRELIQKAADENLINLSSEEYLMSASKSDVPDLVEEKYVSDHTNSLNKIPNSQSSGKKLSVMTYFSNENYNSFENMSITVRKIFRKKFGIKLKATNMAEASIMVCCQMFESDPDKVLSMFEVQVKKMLTKYNENK